MNIAEFQERRKHIKIFSVEGLIGAGKSTLLQQFKTYFPDDIEIIPEPTDIWDKKVIDDKSMLELFYTEPQKYSALFQVYVLSTRLERTISTILSSNKKIFLVERMVPFADYHCFTKTNHASGAIDQFGFHTYKHLYDFALSLGCLDPDLFVILDIPIDTCIDRILKRGRKGEDKISFDYMDKLKHQSTLWYNTIPKTHKFIINKDSDVLLFKLKLESFF